MGKCCTRAREVVCDASIQPLVPQQYVAGDGAGRGGLLVARSRCAEMREGRVPVCCTRARWAGCGGAACECLHRVASGRGQAAPRRRCRVRGTLGTCQSRNQPPVVCEKLRGGARGHRVWCEPHCGWLMHNGAHDVLPVGRGGGGAAHGGLGGQSDVAPLASAVPPGGVAWRGVVGAAACRLGWCVVMCAGQ